MGSTSSIEVQGEEILLGELATAGRQKRPRIAGWIICTLKIIAVIL
jgi:hypothetical protein